MKTPTNLRTDTSIENLIYMLTPILEECELLGRTISMAQLAKLCRNRQRRLPLRSFNGTQMAHELSYLVQGGSAAIGSVSVMLSSEHIDYTRRSRTLVTIERITDPTLMGSMAPALPPEMSAKEKGETASV